VLRAVGETETTQENSQDWFELDDGDPRFRLLVFPIVFKGCTVFFLFIFIGTTYII
jgi:hypothetical protein